VYRDVTEKSFIVFFQFSIEVLLVNFNSVVRVRYSWGYHS